ncbi:hypothetical protein, partial [Salmonella enterica]|uniref:hypothetical protein n=1 Tax=Salmonella enterica TaxID=28901 RepID=UPI003D2BD43D
VSVSPRFNQSTLAQFVDYLFAEELAAEGREVKPTASFIEQLNKWKDSELTRAPPIPMADADDVVEITSAERRRSKLAAAPTESEIP